MQTSGSVAEQHTLVGRGTRRRGFGCVCRKEEGWDRRWRPPRGRGCPARVQKRGWSRGVGVRVSAALVAEERVWV